MRITVDSGAADNVTPVDSFPEVPLRSNHYSKSGKYFLTANRQKVYIKGEKTVLVRTKENQLRKMTFQVADVSKTLLSCKKAAGSSTHDMLADCIVGCASAHSVP